MRSCRFCRAPLATSFVDLGLSPLSNALIPAARAAEADSFYPLHAYVCDACLLVQLEEFESPSTIFSDYVYFSSYSSSWLRHAMDFCDAMISRLGLGQGSFVMELASNDGYLLRNIVARGIRCLGIEPAANVAAVAAQQGSVSWLVGLLLVGNTDILRRHEHALANRVECDVEAFGELQG